MNLIYVCHPLADDFDYNVSQVEGIAKEILDEGSAPMAPHLYLPRLLDDDDPDSRALALEICLMLMENCDVVRVYGTYISEGMELEIQHANHLGIPVVSCLRTNPPPEEHPPPEGCDYVFTVELGEE